MTLKRVLFLLAIAVLLAAQTRITSPAEISGTGVAVQLNATEVARWIQFVAPLSNSATHCVAADITACPRVGDANVSATRGIPIPPGGGYMLPVLPSGQPGYSTAQIYVWIASGDKIDVSWAK
jgi:hypothetical protein